MSTIDAVWLLSASFQIQVCAVDQYGGRGEPQSLKKKHIPSPLFLWTTRRTLISRYCIYYNGSLIDWGAIGTDLEQSY